MVVQGRGERRFDESKLVDRKENKIKCSHRYDVTHKLEQVGREHMAMPCKFKPCSDSSVPIGMLKTETF